MAVDQDIVSTLAAALPAVDVVYGHSIQGDDDSPLENPLIVVIRDSSIGFAQTMCDQTSTSETGITLDVFHRDIESARRLQDQVRNIMAAAPINATFVQENDTWMSGALLWNVESEWTVFGSMEVT